MQQANRAQLGLNPRTGQTVHEPVPESNVFRSWATMGETCKLLRHRDLRHHHWQQQAEALCKKCQLEGTGKLTRPSDGAQHFPGYFESIQCELAR